MISSLITNEKRIYCHVHRNGVDSSVLANGIHTDMVFTTAESNDEGCFNLSNSHFTAPRAGIYFLNCGARTTVAGGNVFALSLNKNNNLGNGSIIDLALDNTASTREIIISTIIRLEAGDYIVPSTYINSVAMYLSGVAGYTFFRAALL